MAPARERILTAAYELFSRRGIRAVGTDEVIERAAVAKATLYRHFEEFAWSWHILMKGAIILAAVGDLEAAHRAQKMARTLVDQHRPSATGLR